MIRKDIVYIGGFELPNRNAAAHRVIANAHIFRELGYNVIFIGVDKGLESSSGLVKSEADYYGFECWSLPYPKNMLDWVRYIVGLASVRDFLISRAPNMKALIAYNYPAVAQLRYSRICRKRGALGISDATEWYDASAGKILYRLVKWLDTSLRMHLVNRLSDAIVTTSQFLTNFYADSNRPALELPTLFVTENFSPPPARKEGCRRFIYVGNPFDAEKVNASRSNVKERLDVLIASFGRLHAAGYKFRFDIYGIDSNRYLAVYPEHIGVLKGCEECVFFHGFADNEFVKTEIAQSDFSVFVRDETRVTLAGFPSKMAESISLGTPVATNVTSNILKYFDKPFVLKLDRSELDTSVLALIDASDCDIRLLSDQAFQSNLFDFRKYISEAETFFEKLKKR
ncbi:MAG: hypothetical protein KBT87_05610 [Gammaproteobacteria bacterium]|nr:hypothetical protein [Gammaproteobacteria bacterium]MBQ0774132.1 hypothetical protein [Gammaproteobacteria bacterium]